MACFLCLHPGGRLEWLPVDLSTVVFVGSLVVWLNLMVFWLSTVAPVREVFTIPWWLLLASFSPGIIAIMFVFRMMARNQSSSDAELRHFSIRNALCAVESDRVVVERNVASLMRDLKLVPANSTREQALAVFDLMVQDTLPRAIRGSVCRAGLRYEHAMTIGAANIFTMFDIVGGCVFAGANVQLVVATIVEQLVFVFSVAPLVLALMMHLSGCCFHITGVKGVAFVLLCFMASLLVLGFFFLATVLLHSAAKDDVFGLVILSLLSAALLFLTYLVFRRPRWIPRRRRAGTTSETLEQLAEALASHTRMRPWRSPRSSSLDVVR